MTEMFYPLDLTAGAPSNYLTGQTYSITQVGGEDYFQFRFREGPVYERGLVLVHQATNRELRPDIDYQLSYPLKAIIGKTNPEDLFAYGVCVILNKKLSGTIIAAYHLVGGDFADANVDFIPTAWSNTPENKTVYYDEILNLPEDFVAASHTVATFELTTGFDDMVTVLWAINDSIRALEPQGRFLIDDIIGLRAELNYKVDYRRNAKVQLTDKFTIASNTLKSQIALSVPRSLESSSLISISAAISSDYGHYRVHARGYVSRTGVRGNVWANAVVRVEGNNAPPAIYLTYNAQNEPTIYIGNDQTNLGKVHVSITDFTTSSSQPDKLWEGFKIFFSAESVTGLTAATTLLDNSHTHTPGEVGAADLFGKSNQQKTITIGGDANTYYPVRVTGLDKAGFGGNILNLYRRYNAPAPGAAWNPTTPTHPGGLTFSMLWNGDGWWGGNGGGGNWTALDFTETYSQMLTDIQPCQVGMVFWLRGGGAEYSFTSEVGNNLVVDVFLTGFTDSSGSRNYLPKAYDAAARVVIKARQVYSIWAPPPFVNHTHPWGELTGIPTYASRWPTWDEVTGKPGSFTPAYHTHPWDQVTGKPATYPASAHGHQIDEVAGLWGVLNNKADINHTHPAKRAVSETLWTGAYIPNDQTWTNLVSIDVNKYDSLTVCGSSGGDFVRRVHNEFKVSLLMVAELMQATNGVEPMMYRIRNGVLQVLSPNQDHWDNTVYAVYGHYYP